MKTSKYIGGSKIVAFRLPKNSLAQAIIEIKEVLARYEREVTETHEKATKSMVAQSETRLNNSNDAAIKNITYKCGCTKTNGLFRRHKDCKELLSKH